MFVSIVRLVLFSFVLMVDLVLCVVVILVWCGSDISCSVFVVILVGKVSFSVWFGFMFFYVFEFSVCCIVLWVGCGRLLGRCLVLVIRMVMWFLCVVSFLVLVDMNEILIGWVMIVCFVLICFGEN